MSDKPLPGPTTDAPRASNDKPFFGEPPPSGGNVWKAAFDKAANPDRTLFYSGKYVLIASWEAPPLKGELDQIASFCKLHILHEVKCTIIKCDTPKAAENAMGFLRTLPTQVVSSAAHDELIFAFDHPPHAEESPVEVDGRETLLRDRHAYPAEQGSDEDLHESEFHEDQSEHEDVDLRSLQKQKLSATASLQMMDLTIMADKPAIQGGYVYAKSFRPQDTFNPMYMSGVEHPERNRVTTKMTLGATDPMYDGIGLGINAETAWGIYATYGMNSMGPDVRNREQAVSQAQAVPDKHRHMSVAMSLHDSSPSFNENDSVFYVAMSLFTLFFRRPDACRWYSLRFFSLVHIMLFDEYGMNSSSTSSTKMFDHVRRMNIRSIIFPGDRYCGRFRLWRGLQPPRTGHQHVVESVRSSRQRAR